MKLKYLKSTFASIIISMTVLLPGVAIAQTDNGRLTSTKIQNVNVNNAVVRLNNLGECDSSCGVDSLALPPASASGGSTTETRVVPCGSGYTGNKTQERTITGGMPSAWADIDTSACVCANTYEESMLACVMPEVGTYTQRRDWTCMANVGSWGAWATTSSGCYTPCVVPSPSTESQTLACGAGFTGSITQERTASCPTASGAVAWSAWSTTSSNCVATVDPYEFLANTTSLMWELGQNYTDSGYQFYLDSSGNFYYYCITLSARDCVNASFVPALEMAGSTVSTAITGGYENIQPTGINCSFATGSCTSSYYSGQPAYEMIIAEGGIYIYAGVSCTPTVDPFAFGFYYVPCVERGGKNYTAYGNGFGMHNAQTNPKPTITNSGGNIQFLTARPARVTP